jgi:hypothetical protein
MRLPRVVAAVNLCLEGRTWYAMQVGSTVSKHPVIVVAESPPETFFCPFRHVESVEKVGLTISPFSFCARNRVLNVSCCGDAGEEKMIRFWAADVSAIVTDATFQLTCVMEQKT